jgi:hypothetical protein
MIKYVEKMKIRLNGLKTGIHNFLTRWTGQPVAETDIDTALTDLNTANVAAEAARAALHEALRGSRAVVNRLKLLADQAETLARGIHSTDPEKLIEYGIKEKKPPAPVPAPGKAHIKSVEKDHDGVGLVITIEALPNAEVFDIRRAVTDAEVLVADPKMFMLIKHTQKLTYVDDEVIAGKRYHYMISGHNHNGDGEPSAVVSAIE